MSGAIEQALRARRDSGGKCLVPYLTGGLGDDWLETIMAVADAGADAIEVGVPFSDPVMDGPTIQEANDRALAGGATPQGILDALRDAGRGKAEVELVEVARRAGAAVAAEGLVPEEALALLRQAERSER